MLRRVVVLVLAFGRTALRRRLGCFVSVAVVLAPVAPGPAASAQLFVQQGPKLTGGGEQGYGNFGFSAALSSDGNTAVVGSPYDAGPYINATLGSVFVYTRAGGVWSQQGPKLVGNCPSDCAHQGTGQVGGNFGYAVAISGDGNTMLVGSRADNGSVGAVWVFTRAGDGWSQQGSKLVGNCSGACPNQGTGETGQGAFGTSVALSADGNTALIGAYGDGNTTGASWVFTRSGTTWSQQGPKLVGSGQEDAARSGWSVALSGDGNTALIGGPHDQTSRGAAWIFTRSGPTWSQATRLVGNCSSNCANQGTGESDQGLFGTSVALSADGGTALIGAPNDQYRSEGAAWVFVRSGSAWSQQGTRLVGNCSASCANQGTGEVGVANFGTSVALSGDGDAALIGGQRDDNETGAAWAFHRSGGAWTQQGAKVIGHCSAGCTGQGAGEAGQGRFGSSAALSGNGDSALIGGFTDNGNVGAVWAFGPPSSPVILAPPTIAGTARASQVLTAAHGSWAYEPTSYALQWQACDTAGAACAPIAGATSASYSLTAADVGHTLRVVETAINAIGPSAPASSAATAVVQAVPQPCTGTPAPRVACTPTPIPTPTPPPKTIRGDQAFVLGTANDLYLACTKLDLYLIDVLPAGRRVSITGAADLRLAGQNVDLLLDGRKVGSAKVGPGGQFAAEVPAPPRRTRARARYQARIGPTASQRLRLVRRMVATTLTRSGSSLLLEGIVNPPRARRQPAIAVDRFLSCRRRQTIKVPRIQLDRHGRFSVRIPIPAGAKAVLYRARTAVPDRTGRPATKVTFTLPRALDIG